MGKMTLEELLNKLIEKGRKPFGENRIDEINRAEQYAWNWNWCCWGRKDAIQRRKSTRELVSKESWLWQFVCENEMVFVPKWEIPYVERNYIFDYESYDVSEFQYWLMVWALLKEDELEEFLLDNIKIDGK